MIIKAANWNLIGSVANNPNVEFGDIMFLNIPNTKTIFLAFREHNSAGQWAITVCKITNFGIDWVYDSTIIAGQYQFVGAPWLFLADNGDLHIYYDSEPLASYLGAYGRE